MSRVPRIRFKGFEEDWEQRKLGEAIQKRNIRTSDFDKFPIFSLTIESGVTPKTERYERSSLVTKTEDLFKVVKPNEFVTNPMNLRFGALGYNTQKYDISVSGYYDVFSIDGNNCSGFWNAYFKTQQVMNIFDNLATGSLVEKKRVKYSTLKQIYVSVPSAIEEKNKISKFMSFTDHLITLHQRKLEKLKIIKKSMLENLFPENGEKTPKIRFSGFTKDWEQRKLGEIVVIERGGSPRPIEKYVTESNDGLNWIKIGDAPTQGRYIIKSSERIKASGLSKTRQVFPGDLILSNSMSFGKPYIMGIEGCIHDGWLLIRNTNNIFYLKFLCHMLSTKYLLDQYKMFAAGSTVNNLNKELVENASVRFPKISEQKKIGKYLESLDHLITLHQLEPFQLIFKAIGYRIIDYAKSKSPRSRK